MAEVFADEVIRKIEKLSENAIRALDRRALRKAAKVVQHEAKDRAPVRTGKLRRSYKVRAGKRSRTRQSVIVRSDLPYTRIIEFGSKKRGIKAHKPLTGALEAKADEVQKIISDAIRDEIAAL